MISLSLSMTSCYENSQATTYALSCKLTEFSVYQYFFTYFIRHFERPYCRNKCWGLLKVLVGLIRVFDYRAFSE